MSPTAIRTLAPGLRPIFLRSVAGMRICPLAEVVTIGIEDPFFSCEYHLHERSITSQAFWG